jgi:hypothetical protein
VSTVISATLFSPSPISQHLQYSVSLVLLHWWTSVYLHSSHQQCSRKQNYSLPSIPPHFSLPLPTSHYCANSGPVDFGSPHPFSNRTEIRPLLYRCLGSPLQIVHYRTTLHDAFMKITVSTLKYFALCQVVKKQDEIISIYITHGYDRKFVKTLVR